MKKKYMRPYLGVETFQLNAAIAGSCNPALAHAQENCTYTDQIGFQAPDYLFFGQKCGESENGMDVISMGTNPDGSCYQVYADGPFLES